MPISGKGLRLGRYAGGKRHPPKKGTKNPDEARARDAARIAALERTTHELVAAVHGRAGCGRMYMHNLRKKRCEQHGDVV